MACLHTVHHHSFLILSNWAIPRPHDPTYHRYTYLFIQFRTFKFLTIMTQILYTYITMTHYKSFSAILLTCKVSTSSTNYQLPHHPTIDKSLLYHMISILNPFSLLHSTRRDEQNYILLAYVLRNL
jgi:hypothetical protein